MNILITGITGFLGRNLLEYIKSNKIDKIYNFYFLTREKIPDFNCVIYNDYVFSPNLISKIDFDIILHIGGYIPKKQDDIENLEKNLTNITFTRSLLKGLNNKVKKFIYISTVDVYGKTDRVIDELCIPNPNNLYGLTKLSTEKIVQDWCTQNNTIINILRIGHLYGKGEEHFQKLIPETIKKVINNENPVLFTDGTEKRSFLNVFDCARLIIKSMQIDTSNIINIVSANALNVKEIIELIIKISENKDVQINYKYKDILQRDLIFDNHLMRILLDAEEISFEKGLKEEYVYIAR